MCAVSQHLKHRLLLLLLVRKSFSHFRYLCLQFLNLLVFSKSNIVNRDVGKRGDSMTKRKNYHLGNLKVSILFRKEIKAYNSTGRFNFHEIISWEGKEVTPDSIIPWHSMFFCCHARPSPLKQFPTPHFWKYKEILAAYISGPNQQVPQNKIK